MPKHFTQPALGVFAALALLLPARPVAAEEAVVPLWGRWERAFEAARDAGPDTELAVEATAPSGKRRTVPGFWDGGATWRVRLMPDEAGKWTYRTRSRPAVEGLDRQDGGFTCRPGKDRNAFEKHGPVRVAPSGTYLEHADRTPFFWLGDTVWSGPTLSSVEDWDAYLKDRAAKRFSVVQFNAVAPWRASPADADGQVAFARDRGVRINPSYFRRLDARMDAINAHGLLAAPVLVWANKKDDPGNALPEEDVVRLLRYEVARYGAHQVAWILAGDNTYKGESAARWQRIGRAVFGDRPHAPVTTHPTGMNWPWEDWRGEKWLDFVSYQSGHGDDARTLRWLHSGPVHEGWAKPPVRPLINLEPPYEDHKAYQSRRPHGASNVRRAVYWSLLAAPPAGVTYGAHGLWSWQTEEGKEPLGHPGTGVAKTWRQALDLPGSVQMRHLAELFAALPWWRLRPADDLLASQPGGDDPAGHVSAARSPEGDLALLYLPAGGKAALRPGVLADGLRAEWFDPRSGRSTVARGAGANAFEAPDGQDWLLVVRPRKERTAP